MSLSQRTVDIPLEKIRLPKNEMRETYTHEGIDELKESIREIGLRQALNVRPVGDFFEVVAGARRFECLKLLDWETAPCVVEQITDEKAEVIKIHENLKREDVDPVEEGAYYQRLVDDFGWSLDRIAKATGRGFAYLEGRIEINRWPANVRSAITARKIGIGVGRELAKFSDSEACDRFLIAAANNGVTARTMESWRLQYEADVRRGLEKPAEGVENENKQSAYRVSTFCELCGEDLHGVITHYVPISQRCKDEMARVRNSSGKNAAA